jgi:hypothetical protein
MAEFFDRVGFYTSTTGNVSTTIAIGARVQSAVDGDYLTPTDAGIADTQVVSYVIIDGNNFEIQKDQAYSSGGATLARGTPLKSMIAGVAGTSKITLSGNAKVFVVPLASDIKPHGECVLTKSGANLLLAPQDGNRLTINGVSRVVPSAGVTLAATGLTVGTLYYIYAFMSGATMTLEASATAPATDSGTGIRIKTGDATRTLVGMARPITGPAWADSATQRFVRSWFYPQPLVMSKAFTAVRTTTSTTPVEVNTEIRLEALVWGNEALNLTGQGPAKHSVSTGNVIVSLAQDGTGVGSGMALGTAYDYITTVVFFTAAEGYHYYTILGYVITAGTASYGDNSTVFFNLNLLSTPVSR